MTVRTCDDFYSIMAVLAREMLEFGLMEPNHLVQVKQFLKRLKTFFLNNNFFVFIQTIVSMGSFPLAGLSELRDKYR